MSNELLVREFPLEAATVGDGRTVDVRVVPWTESEVSDGGPTYRERWERGVFDHQTTAAHRVWLSFEHEQGLRGVVGHGIELVSRDDGFHGSFRVLDGADGDKALQMVNKGLLPGVSLEAIPHRSEKRDGVVVRLKATLRAVSLVRFPAFKGAEVLAVREQPPDEPAPDEPSPEPEPEEPSEAALALERIGFEPLIVRAVTRKPWNGSASRFEDDEYKRSCLIDRGGDAPIKERCSLPVLEPNGDVNVNALGAAAAVLAGARGGLRSVSAADKAKAARKLMRLYMQADMDPPDSLRRVAAS